jgi:RNA polymerase-binding transcription factor
MLMPLTSAQREHIEERLREERERALRALNRSVSDSESASEQDRTGELSKMPFHMADRGTEAMNEELEASNATRISEEVAEIDEALDRLYRDPEHFGICADTGREIPMERLEIIPWARTCNEAGAS